jgi:hypothetical protein
VGVLTDNAKEHAIQCATVKVARMLARGHRLKVGEVGMVGYVTGTGKARAALDTGKDAVFFNNPTWETHSEIACHFSLEMLSSALDVQSTQINAATGGCQHSQHTCRSGQHSDPERAAI